MRSLVIVAMLLTSVVVAEGQQSTKPCVPGSVLWACPEDKSKKKEIQPPVMFQISGEIYDRDMVNGTLILYIRGVAIPVDRDVRHVGTAIDSDRSRTLIVVAPKESQDHGMVFMGIGVYLRSESLPNRIGGLTRAYIYQGAGQ